MFYLRPMAIALSIRQPWVELILSGRKTIEVRSWATQHRGELWLHAGATRNSHLLREFSLREEDLQFGALVGVCELQACLEFDDDTWDRWRSQHLNEGDLNGRRFAWFLRNPNRIVPKSYKGRLGLMRI